jgi:hypothetical protein
MLLRRPGLRQGGCRRAFPGPSNEPDSISGFGVPPRGRIGGRESRGASHHRGFVQGKALRSYQYATGIGSIKSCFRPRPALVLCVSPASLQASCQGQAAFLINKLQKCPCDGKP